MSAATHSDGCLLCRQHDGGFTAREHIFPEALGDGDHVLDPGIVCDRCNHGPLASIDGALVNFPPIAMRRTVLRIPGKRGTHKLTSTASRDADEISRQAQSHYRMA